MVPVFIESKELDNEKHADVKAKLEGVPLAEAFMLVLDMNGTLIVRERNYPFMHADEALAWFEDFDAAIKGLKGAEAAYAKDESEKNAAALAKMYFTLKRFEDALPLLEKALPSVRGKDGFELRMRHIRTLWELARVTGGGEEKAKAHQNIACLFETLFAEMVEAKDSRIVDLALGRTQPLMATIPLTDVASTCERLLETFLDHSRAPEVVSRLAGAYSGVADEKSLSPAIEFLKKLKERTVKEKGLHPDLPSRIDGAISQFEKRLNKKN